MAVFTLPQELIGFYKTNIDYVTEHAVDPDKRRYASRHEGPRHFIDIDHWDVYPFDNVPRDFEEAIIKHCKIKLIDGKDTIYLDKQITSDSIVLSCDYNGGIRLASDYEHFVKYWKKVVKPMYYDLVWSLTGYDIDILFETRYFDDKRVDFVFEDHFSEFGIVPYQLEISMRNLTYAFERVDKPAIIKLSTEFGHYIADAHVPLHTTSNYNGQLTNQDGIHAFWESRIPELFAHRDYDFFVGKAVYIEDPKEYFWEIVLKAHSYVDSVLLIEKRLSETFDSDLQFCYDERLGRTIRTQCPEYAEAYSKAMGPMVEEQMRSSIIAVGSLIYTSWVNAGQPDIPGHEFVKMDETPIVPDANVKPRAHE